MCVNLNVLKDRKIFSSHNVCVLSWIINRRNSIKCDAISPVRTWKRLVVKETSHMIDGRFSGWPIRHHLSKVVFKTCWWSLRDHNCQKSSVASLIFEYLYLHLLPGLLKELRNSFSRMSYLLNDKWWFQIIDVWRMWFGEKIIPISGGCVCVSVCVGGGWVCMFVCACTWCVFEWWR